MHFDDKPSDLGGLRDQYPRHRFYSVDVTKAKEVVEHFKLSDEDSPLFKIYNEGEQIDAASDDIETKLVQTTLDKTASDPDEGRQPDLRFTSKQRQEIIDTLKVLYFNLVNKDLPVFHIEAKSLQPVSTTLQDIRKGRSRFLTLPY